MPFAASEGIGADPLAVWYLEAEPVFYALSDCCDIIRSVQSSTTGLTTAYLHDLSSMIQESEIWLLTNPAPNPLHGEYVESVLHVFGALGKVFSESRPTGPGDNIALDAKIPQAEWMVAEAKGIRDDRILRSMGD
jgi:hypothetical protein